MPLVSPLNFELLAANLVSLEKSLVDFFKSVSTGSLGGGPALPQFFLHWQEVEVEVFKS